MPLHVPMVCVIGKSHVSYNISQIEMERVSIGSRWGMSAEVKGLRTEVFEVGMVDYFNAEGRRYGGLPINTL